ncbi:MAG TPA: PfkB family carbohydrate kinase, partial [Rhodothermales bacterium]
VSVLAVGTVAFDSIETPFGAAPRILGGSATYITLAARYFCEDVRLLAVVGDDFPENYLNVLRDGGVDLEGLETRRGEKTFAWEGRYHFDMNGRDTLATHLNVLEKFDPVVPQRYRDSRIVCLGNLAPSVQQSVLEQINRPELVVCDTMNFWIENTPDDLRRTLERVDLLIINDAEARQLSGEPNLVRAARIIRGMGPRSLVIKKGEHGALLFADGCVFSAPAFPLEDIHDPTGAGDTFAGGLVGYLAGEERIDHDALKRAIIHASAMASFAVERFGPERLIDLSLDEIRARAAAFHELTSIPLLVQA